jgi:hypothetical protein
MMLVAKKKEKGAGNIHFFMEMLNCSILPIVLSHWQIHADGPNGSGKTYKACLQ